VDGHGKEAGQMTYKDKSMRRARADAAPTSWFPVLHPERDGPMDTTHMMSEVAANIDDSVSKAVGGRRREYPSGYPSETFNRE
jgi:hypothetical protein